MPLYLDRIERSEEVWGYAGMMRAVRTAYYGGLDGGGISSGFLTQACAMGGVIVAGSPHPSDPTGKCVLTRIKAVPKGGTEALVLMTYERIQQVEVTDSSTLIQSHTQLLPGKRLPLRITWKFPDADTASAAMNKSSTISYMTPVRTLTVAKSLFRDNIPNEIREAQGCVNSKPWMGKPPGYWICSELTSQAVDPLDDFSTCLYIRAIARFYCKNIEDWSYWNFLQLPSGDYAEVMELDIVTELDIDYPDNAPSFHAPANKGFIRVFPYKAVDFAAIFGIGDYP